VTDGGRDLHAGDADQAVLRGHLDRVEAGGYLVVVGDGDGVETHGRRLFEQVVDRVPPVV